MRLAAEDVETMKAITDPAKLAAVEARKQKLRDMPATVQAKLKTLKTPEALEAFEPTWP